MFRFNGLDVVIVDPPRVVRRTWKERLFTWPWRPLLRQRVYAHPMWGVMRDGKVFHVGDKLYVTRKQYELLKTELNNV